MTDPVELLPLLVVVVLLLSLSGERVEQMEVVFEGDREITEIDDVLVVGGGTVTVPANENVSGPVYVVGGDLRIRGRLDGDVDQLAGNVTVVGTGAVAGELRTIAGNASVAPGATVGTRTTVPIVQQEPSPAREYGFLALRALVLALAAGLLARREPALLRNVGDSVVHHPVVSGVVGAFTGATALALFVFMAFTLVLIPVSLFGLAVGLLTVAYAYVAYGYLVGRALPGDRPDLAAAAGAALVVVAVDLLGRVPLVGTAVQFVLVATGLGAVLVTYYGFREFEPALADFPE
ncbi:MULTISPECIES: polymer-forming cytoskeletal protein [Halorussus]|uniref:polymer-forming cytoskeletal protein n=1 Tax=Halorussus TaxID=1070314 RepID=UPI000E20F884|nr:MULTISPECIES: polymer-forming cytoskeletal protein [Halorussus]NHN58392.1 polymer-forming cytoskeletal protein [Halorussus sp. JP-T4]